MNTKNIVFLVGIAVIAVLLFWFWQQGVIPFGQQTEEPAGTEGDTTQEIQQQLDEVDLGDLDTEFQDIDKDLESL